MRVFSNTAVSLDGRIGTVNGDHFNVGTDEDRRRMALFQAKADAVFVGGTTFRMGPHPIVEPVGLARVEGQRPIINAVLTRDGVASAMGDDWPDPRVDLHVFGPATLDVNAHRARGATVHLAAGPMDALDKLEEMGCRSVLIEGGGDLIFQLVAADRLDSIYITLAPRIIGGVGAPSLADGVGFSADDIRDFRLVDMEQLGDELFLRYDKKR
jgi:2,5-diamino-6-(ribosylamino)-4(3H)-pyrimidinone 5'-phosphate reductase